MLDPPVYEGAERPEGGRGAGAAGVAGGGGSGAAGDVEAAAWAVDTDEEDEEGGGVAWEEVELPERNEDIDPEVACSLSLAFAQHAGECSGRFVSLVVVARQV